MYIRRRNETRKITRPRTRGGDPRATRFYLSTVHSGSPQRSVSDRSVLKHSSPDACQGNRDEVVPFSDDCWRVTARSSTVEVASRGSGRGAGHEAAAKEMIANHRNLRRGEGEDHLRVSHPRSCHQMEEGESSWPGIRTGPQPPGRLRLTWPGSGTRRDSLAEANVPLFSELEELRRAYQRIKGSNP